jgi:DNA-directed RNA polymerase subunit RPC12/RpoP
MSISKEDYPYVLIHETCEDEAFYINHKPGTTKMLQSKDAIGINGEEVNPGDEVRCSTCGLRVLYPAIESVKERL